MMENVNAFLEIAKQLGLLSQELFQSVDLVEKRNMSAVMITLQALARKGTVLIFAPNFFVRTFILLAQKYNLPSLGPKESEENIRQFTEEQLRASESTVSLQYGYNKGATQAGQSFGNTRHM